MNRKQKIIVSITGIFLILLILLGLTYAYFLTQITGNQNPTSISVTTANLELLYEDGNGVLEIGDKLRPGNSVNFKTSSGTTVNEKTFKVINNGDTTDYVVIVDNVSITKDGVSTTFNSNDFEYNLTCVSTDNNDCDGVTESVFPLKEQSILIGNKIASGVTHTYTLTMKYKETNVNQSADMGKTFTAKIDIEDIRRLDNPFNEGTLAYNIINNSLNATNGTQLRATPLNSPKNGISSEYTVSKNETREYDIDYYETNIGDGGIYCVYTDPKLAQIEFDNGRECNNTVSVSSKNEFVGKYFYTYDSGYSFYPMYVESYNSETNKFVYRTLDIIPEQTLSIAEDDYGTSYYYRGAVEDNYVSFAGFTWRIVRINGDGSIRLILDGTFDKLKKTGEDFFIYNNQELIDLMDNGLYESYDHINAKNIPFNYYPDYNSFLGYMYGNSDINYDSSHQNVNSSFIKSYIDKFYELYLSNYESYLGDSLFCGDKTLASDFSQQTTGYGQNDAEYGAYERLAGYSATPTLECAKNELNNFSRYTSNSIKTTKNISVNNDLDYSIGLLSADEAVFAGGYYQLQNNNYYLSNNSSTFWTMSPSYYKYDSIEPGEGAHLFTVGTYGLGITQAESTFLYLIARSGAQVRPVINLKSTVEVQSGNGTSSSPYVLKSIS